jgi:hypothetical protein
MFVPEKNFKSALVLELCESGVLPTANLDSPSQSRFLSIPVLPRAVVEADPPPAAWGHHRNPTCLPTRPMSEKLPIIDEAALVRPGISGHELNAARDWIRANSTVPRSRL